MSETDAPQKIAMTRINGEKRTKVEYSVDAFAEAYTRDLAERLAVAAVTASGGRLRGSTHDLGEQQ